MKIYRVLYNEIFRESYEGIVERHEKHWHFVDWHNAVDFYKNKLKSIKQYLNDHDDTFRYLDVDGDDYGYFTGITLASIDGEFFMDDSWPFETPNKYTDEGYITLTIEEIRTEDGEA